MSFVVDDFRDLLLLLREHPDWKAELRREILGDELIGLPDLVRENTRAIAELREATSENTRAIVELREATRELRAETAENTRAIAELREAVHELRMSLGEIRTTLDQFIEATNRRFTGVDNDLAMLKGLGLEAWFTRHFGVIVEGLRKPRLVDAAEVEDLLDSAALSVADKKTIRLVDIMLTGIEGRGDAATDVRVAVEVSNVIDRHDVERAIRNRELLGRLGLPARAAVAGQVIIPNAAELAQDSGVTVTIHKLDQA